MRTANGARDYRKKLEKQSADFAAAYEYSLANKPTRYADLPVMPVRIPYDAEFTMETEEARRLRLMFKAALGCDLGPSWQAELKVKTEALLDEVIAEFNAATEDKVALMRGETDSVRDQLRGDASLVAVKEVKSLSRKGELAIVVLRVCESEKGTNTHIGFSCWPKSVWPGYSGKKPGSMISPLRPCAYTADGRRVDWEETWHMWYFKPGAWRKVRVRLGFLNVKTAVKPVFDKATERQAEALYETMRRMLAKWPVCSEESTNDEQA